MKMKPMIKKCISVMLLLAVTVCCGLSGTANAETYTIDGNGQDEVCSFLESYFSNLVDTVRADSQKDFTSEDFSSIKGYIVAKQFVNKRQVYKKLLGGIEKVRLNEVVLEDLSSMGDKMEAMVYVKYSFAYADDPEECSVGTLYRVSLLKTAGGYCVLDLDSDSIETRMAKEAILGNSDLANVRNASDENPELDYAVADAYFAELEQNTESLLQDNES